MPTLYHGTSRAFAIAMRGPLGNPGTVDVTRGGGEFGGGFYTQDSISNAVRRGYLIYGNRAALLILTIDDQPYHLLYFRRLTLNQAQRLNHRLRGHARSTYATRHDAIVGPLASQPRIMQQKFQSTVAQNLLNGQYTLRTVHP